MDAQNWINYKEFNKKTAENYRKRQQEKAEVPRIGAQIVEEKRRQNRLIVLDLYLTATALTALGVLIGCMVG